MELEELKQQYNKVLLEFWNATTYMENPKIPLEKRLKWLPKYQAIVDEVSNLCNLINAIQTMKEYEIMGGFYEEVPEQIRA